MGATANAYCSADFCERRDVSRASAEGRRYHGHGYFRFCTLDDFRRQRASGRGGRFPTVGPIAVEGTHAGKRFRLDWLLCRRPRRLRPRQCAGEDRR